MDYLKIANSFPMWLAAGLAISLALFQAIIFAKKSYSTGKEIGLTEEQMKSAIKSSFITSLGPSIVILTGLLSLLVTVGGPMAWMRLSFIGSVMFEMMAAGFGTEAVGVKMGIDPMTNIAFANAVWTMILGSLGWIIFSTLTADKMEKVQTKFSKGDKGLLSIISITAMLGSFGSLVSGHLIAMNKNTIAALTGAAIMLILSPIADKKNIKWLKEWALTIALFGGMVIAALI
ncbi:DUF5058 family protein [Tissierella sp.]|uniref:DUF5058 family protein n=1 Tax=Tissierella sp. TaxID=41274 RepID=UPI0028A58CA6|nr:DUF5058 family protein [Tissierella sp.]